MQQPLQLFPRNIIFHHIKLKERGRERFRGRFVFRIVVGVEVRVGETLFDCVAFAGIDYWDEERGIGGQSWLFFSLFSWEERGEEGK